MSVCSFSISFVIPFENLKPTENQQGNLNQEKHSMSVIARDTTCPVTVMFVQLLIQLNIMLNLRMVA